jgi:hypothetical protein
MARDQKDRGYPTPEGEGMKDRAALGAVFHRGYL